MVHTNSRSCQGRPGFFKEPFHCEIKLFYDVAGSCIFVEAFYQAITKDSLLVTNGNEILECSRRFVDDEWAQLSILFCYT